MNHVKKILGLLKVSVQAWSDDSVSMMSGSLAYSTIFSIAPLLIIATAVSGFVFGEEASRGEIFSSIHSLIGEDGARAIEAMIQSSAGKKDVGIFATVLGVITMLVGASSSFSQLQQSLNMIWKVKARTESGIVAEVRKRLLTFSMVLVIAFFLLVSLILSAAISALGKYFGTLLPGGEVFWQVLNALISFGVITTLFAAIFKILPEVDLRWRDVWVGAAVTAFFFTVGKFLIGFYIGKSGMSSTYGTVGSLVVFLVWVYFSSAILFYGVEFTRAYVEQQGKGN